VAVGGRKMAGEVARKIAAVGAQVGRDGGYGAIFRSLASSIKTIHKLGFLIYIVSFQLAQKLGNLVMFWLSNYTLKHY